MTRGPVYKLDGAMTGAKLKYTRSSYGLSAAQWGRLLGCSGRNVAVHLRRLESGSLRIPPAVEKLALMYALNGIPTEWRASSQRKASAAQHRA
jgi:hypothetical protein